MHDLHAEQSPVRPIEPTDGIAVVLESLGSEIANAQRDLDSVIAAARERAARLERLGRQ